MKKINYASFNQDRSLLLCCYKDGYTVYNIREDIVAVKNKPIQNGVKMIKNRHNSNLSLMVPNTKEGDIIIIWDESSHCSIKKEKLHTEIKNIHTTTNCIIVTVQDHIYIYNYNMVLLQDKETSENKKGLCSINNSVNNLIIATIGNKNGRVEIWNTKTNITVNIDAHENSINCIVLNREGTLVATSSIKGTLIRVFSTEDGKKLYELRRGSNKAEIFDMSFSPNSKYLACVSSSGTSHIFDLKINFDESKNRKSMLAYFRNYLPQYCSSQWSFKYHNIGRGADAKCGFDNNNNLHIITYDGKYFKIGTKNSVFDNVEYKFLIENKEN